MYDQSKYQEKIVKGFKRKKIITLLGPRQVGKTTLLEQIIEEVGNKAILTLNCDDEDDRALLQGRSSTELKYISMTTASAMLCCQISHSPSIEPTWELYGRTF